MPVRSSCTYASCSSPQLVARGCPLSLSKGQLVKNRCLARRERANHQRMKRTLALLLLFSITAWATHSQPQTIAVPYPQDFRSWQHVKSIVIEPEHPSFARRGGI